MAHVSVWLHTVWATKNREKILVTGKRELICEHIKQNASEKGFYIDIVNGYLDHLHCLMALRSDWTVAKQLQMIKGEAAHWANKNSVLENKLEWADEYFAASVSMDKLDIVRNYILNQEAHHRTNSFEAEYVRFLSAYGLNQG
ncbi:MAG TPA: transposase [Sediminibacterium sp.]